MVRIVLQAVVQDPEVVRDPAVAQAQVATEAEVALVQVQAPEVVHRVVEQGQPEVTRTGLINRRPDVNGQ